MSIYDTLLLVVFCIDAIVIITSIVKISFFYININAVLLSGLRNISILLCYQIFYQMVVELWPLFWPCILPTS